MSYVSLSIVLTPKDSWQADEVKGHRNHIAVRSMESLGTSIQGDAYLMRDLATVMLAAARESILRDMAYQDRRTCEHSWPAELDGAACEMCGLAYDDWTE